MFLEFSDNITHIIYPRVYQPDIVPGAAPGAKAGGLRCVLRMLPGLAHVDSGGGARFAAAGSHPHHRAAAPRPAEGLHDGHQPAKAAIAPTSTV